MKNNISFLRSTLLIVFSFASSLQATSNYSFVPFQTTGATAINTVVSAEGFKADEVRILKIESTSMIDTFNICSTVQITNAFNGKIFDPGGATGTVTGTNYCTFLIDPGCADNITLQLNMFQLGVDDYIEIADRGPNSGASQGIVRTYCSWGCSTLPITTTGGKMFIRFVKISPGTYSGFELTWTTTLATAVLPVSAFTADNSNPPLKSAVKFSNQSTGVDMDYLWDYGDGATSETTNGIHEYDLPGTYLVKLISTNCIGSDTATLAITVQDPPSIQVLSDTIDVSVNCGDTITVPVWIKNNGVGDLVINKTGYTNLNDTIHILVYTRNINTNAIFLFTGTLNTYFNKYTLTSFNSTDTAQLALELKNKQIILFPSTYYTTDTIFDYLEKTVHNFVSAGGIALVNAGSNSLEDLRLRKLNLLNAKLLSPTYIASYDQIDTLDFLAENYSNVILPLITLCYPMEISNKYKKTIFGSAGKDIVSYRYVGLGKAVYNGYKLSSPMNDIGKVITSNSIKMAQNRWPEWMQVTPNIEIIASGDSSLTYFTMVPTGLPGGLYEIYISVNANDPIHAATPILIRLNVNGNSLLELQDTCLNFGAISVGDSSIQTITLKNSGCDTLKIFSASSVNNSFIVNLTMIDLPINTSTTLDVKFLPLSTNQISDTIYFQTNNGIYSLCALGEGVLAPHITFSSSTINITHNICGDSSNVGFWLKNDGGDTLNFSIISGQTNLPRRILSMNYGVDYNLEFTNVKNGIQNYFSDFTLDTLNSSSGITLANRSKNKDAILFPRQKFYNDYTTNINASVQNFSIAGGNVIVMGSDFHTNLGFQPLLYRFGLFAGSDSAQITNGTCQVNLSNDPFMDGVSPSFPVVSTTYLQKITSPDKKTIVSSSGKDVVTFRKYGKGHAIYVGYDFSTSSSDIENIISNVVRNINRENFPVGLTLSTIAGSILPGDSTYINISSHLDGISGGNYYLNVLVDGNENYIDKDSLQLNIQLGSNPCSDFRWYNDSLCDGSVHFFDYSINLGTTWKWYFGDGDSSAFQNPIHQYANTGNYTVTLISMNSTDTSTYAINVLVVKYAITINVSGTPVAGNTLNFTYNSTNLAFTRVWDFGDGSTSTAFTPTHVYASPGVYIVTLTLSNVNCFFTIIDTIYILAVGLSENIAPGTFTIQPNPFIDQTEIKFELTKASKVDLRVVDITGRIINRFCFDERKEKGIYSFPFRNQAAGMYQVMLYVDGQLMVLKMVKEE